MDGEVSHTDGRGDGEDVATNGAAGQPRWRHVLRTHVGHVRERNEDLAWGDDALGLYLLADGMGGHPDGNVAARIAVETAGAWLRESAAQDVEGRGERLIEAITRANQAIRTETARQPAVGVGMGTTLTCLWLDDDGATLAHVGDSRVYRFRKGRAEPLTRDQTVAEELIERGLIVEGSAEAKQLGHVLTQAVGLDDELVPVVSRIEREASDIFLLCSDGLSDLVSSEAMAHLLAEAGGDLEAAAGALVDAALAAGGYDNVTVLLAGEVS